MAITINYQPSMSLIGGAAVAGGYGDYVREQNRRADQARAEAQRTALAYAQMEQQARDRDLSRQQENFQRAADRQFRYGMQQSEFDQQTARDVGRAEQQKDLENLTWKLRSTHADQDVKRDFDLWDRKYNAEEERQQARIEKAIGDIKRRKDLDPSQQQNAIGQLEAKRYDIKGSLYKATDDIEKAVAARTKIDKQNGLAYVQQPDGSLDIRPIPEKKHPAREAAIKQWEADFGIYAKEQIERAEHQASLMQIKTPNFINGPANPDGTPGKQVQVDTPLYTAEQAMMEAEKAFPRRPPPQLQIPQIDSSDDEPSTSQTDIPKAPRAIFTDKDDGTVMGWYDGLNVPPVVGKDLDEVKERLAAQWQMIKGITKAQDAGVHPGHQPVAPPPGAPPGPQVPQTPAPAADPLTAALNDPKIVEIQREARMIVEKYPDPRTAPPEVLARLKQLRDQMRGA